MATCALKHRKPKIAEDHVPEIAEDNIQKKVEQKITDITNVVLEFLKNKEGQSLGENEVFFHIIKNRKEKIRRDATFCGIIQKEQQGAVEEFIIGSVIMKVFPEIGSKDPIPTGYSKHAQSLIQQGAMVNCIVLAWAIQQNISSQDVCGDVWEKENKLWMKNVFPDSAENYDYTPIKKDLEKLKQLDLIPPRTVSCDNSVDLQLNQSQTQEH